MAAGVPGMSREIDLHRAAEVPQALVPVTHMLPLTKLDPIASVMEFVPCHDIIVVFAGTVQL